MGWRDWLGLGQTTAPIPAPTRTAEEERVYILAKTIMDTFAKPKGDRYQLREVVAALALVMMRLGHDGLKIYCPELDCLDMEAVERHYMVQPTMSAALVLQGNIMWHSWGDEVEADAGSPDHSDCSDPGSGDSETLQSTS